MTKKIIATVAILLSLHSFSFAQKASSSIKGMVVDTKGNPLDFASIILKPSGLYTLSDADGQFSLKGIPAGRVEAQVQYYGMQDVDTTFTLNAGQEMVWRVVMHETSFRLENVTVTATHSEAGRSTASTISRQAMDHMQTGSLMDVMSLLPGGSTINPSLSQAQTLSVRGMGSLGTAVIVDGVPLSNNANMQTLTTAQSGSMADQSGSVSASGGVDVRVLSTDNVESVEVIRGIPSVEYGDMTAGAVIVKSKAGKSPLTLRFKTNPNIYQASIGKGFGLGGGLGDLNISGDYAYNRNNLLKDNITYQRAGVKALWSYMKGSFTETTTLAGSFGRDRQKITPDTSGNEQSWSNALGAQFSTTGHYFFNKSWLKAINWLVSGSYTNKVSHYEGLASNALNLYSNAMIDGITYTNTPGQVVFDSITGEQITNSEGTGIKGAVLPYSYDYMYDIFGDEVNAFAKVNANFSHTWGGFTEKLLVGADFKTDGNLGKGPIYDDELPPWRNISNASSGYRKRPFYTIPFVNQFGVYVENAAEYRLGLREFRLSAGLRYDKVNNLSLLAPRINASADIFPWLTLRGGWGITGKAPTSLYLNPNYAYLDAMNYNGMYNTRPEQDRMLIATSGVYDSRNPNLTMATNRKAEVGLDLTIARRYHLSVTAYDELMAGDYTMGLGLESFIPYKFTTYKETAYTEGSLPQITKDNTYNMFFTVYRPYNNRQLHNRGIEYEIDLGRFEAIRTAFAINGAWTLQESSSASYAFNTKSNSLTTESHIGVYSKTPTVGKYESFNTVLRATHNIPQVGFVVTLTAEMKWFANSWTDYNKFVNEVDGQTYQADEMFAYYISYKDGLLHPFNPADKTNSEFAYMFSTLTDSRYIVDKTPAYAIFNINISKELGDALTASFYANNVINYRLLDRSETSGTKREVGIPLFFGFELKVNIK